jgi:ribonuclease E
MKKEMLINVRQSEECRIAIIENGVLEELYVDRTSHETFSGNIYKGRIVNLEPAIQAAFVDFSIGRNGFLHVSDVEPRYYRTHLGDDIQLGGRDRGRDPRRVVSGEERPQGVEPRSESEPRSPRPPRSDRGRRSRDDRRGGSSFGQDIAVTSTYETPGGYGTSRAFPTTEEPVEEAVVDLASSELPARRAPRPDGRRDRSRRGSGRGERPGRGPRDRIQEPRNPAESFPDQPDLSDEFGFDAQDVPNDRSFSPEPTRTEIRTEPEPRFDARNSVPETTETIVSEDIDPQPPRPLPRTAPDPIPVPQARPSFVTRVRRAFGSGLEDWDTADSGSTTKSRTPLTPITPPITKHSPPAQSSQDTDPDEPLSKSVTRSLPPAPPNPPGPNDAPLPSPSKRSRFGSGLLDDSEEPGSSARQRYVPVTPIPKPIPPVPPQSSAFGWSDELVEADQPAGFNESSADNRFPVEDSMAIASIETWPEFASTEPEQDTVSSDSETGEDPPARNRRRRSGSSSSSSSSGRGRSRQRRPADDDASESDRLTDAVESEPLEGSTEVPSADADFAQESYRSPRGRDAIRARGGNRESRGPRPQIHVREREIEPEVRPQEEDDEPRTRPGTRGVGPNRYIPRLERERLRTPGGASDSPFMEIGPEEGPIDSGFDDLTADADSAELGSDSEFGASLGEDPRLQPRGRDARGRRRRRRRRPGGPETAARPGESVRGSEEPSDELSEPLEPNDDAGAWAELDWSNSPPGAAEALSASQPLDDIDSDDVDEPSRPRGRQRRRVRRPRNGPEVGPAPGEDVIDDPDDDFLETSGRSYAIDPNDIVEPELEEEIRREAEEIALLEIDLGIRMPGEIRESPRSGSAPGGGKSSMGGGRGFFKPPIQEVFHRNDEVLVQVIKESLGTKGPTLSTYISIPGRYLVLMPGLNRVGVSRKIADEGQRRKLRDLMNQLNPPKGLGFIVRTAGVDRSKRELARDLAYLLRLWKTILKRIKRTKSPAPIYQESDMIIRTIRDIFNSEIDTIWIDEPTAYERAHEFLKNVMPKFVDRLKLYEDKTPLFHKYGIEDEIAKIGLRHVPLPDGGSIVIDQTEALVAIDVNSGNFRVEDDAEQTAYQMNLRAAKEIARQLRLRDLGGVIVNDFIDMRDERHRRGVERALRDAIRRDRARTKILRMSQFGLIEMTRQRIRPSIKRSIYEDCQHCSGQGVVKTPESMSIDVMRILALAANRNDIRRINITCSHAVANYLNNRKRQDLARLERDGHMSVHIRPEDHVPAEFLQIDGLGNYNTEFRLYPTAAMTSNRRVPNTTGNAPALPYNASGPGGHHSQFH